MVYSELTPDQKQAYNVLVPLLGGRQGNVATLEGFAGTGKTTTTSAIVRALHDAGLRVAVTAPTNKAVSVLQDKIGDGPAYSTIHAALGFKLVQQIDGTGKLVAHRAPALAEFDVVVVDEASMLGDELFAPVLAVARQHHVGVLFVGDPAQLLPVSNGPRASISSAFTDKVPVRLRLSRIVRQAEENPVLRWSVLLREAIERNEAPDIGALSATLRQGDERLCQILHADDDLIHAWAADAYAHGHDMRVLAYTNATVVRHNKAIHRRIFGDHAAPYEVGEPLMAGDGNAKLLVRGGYVRISLQNGALLTVREVLGPTTCVEDGFAAHKVVLAPEGGGPEMDALLADEPDAVQAEIAARFAKVRRLKAEQKDAEAGALSRSAYALRDLLPDIRHAYAMTVHKSQGSTFETVIVDWRDAMRSTSMQPGELSRLLYVAVTRPSKHCVIVV